MLGDSPLPAVAGNMLLNQTDWNESAQAESGEKGLTVASGLMVLPTHSRQQFTLSLQLFPGILKSSALGNWTYALRMQKQPGLAILPVTVTLKLPEGATPTVAAAGWVQQTGQTWTWQGNLTGPQDLSLTFYSKP